MTDYFNNTLSDNPMTLLPPRGMRDFPPEIAILRKEIFERIEKIYQSFGFDPVITPIVEYWETLKGKYGDETENKLIWRFKVPYSEKEYALRYDHTVPLARFFARFKPKLPFKRYVIDRVYRYEEPQKGRYREFWQADFDIVGSPYPEADAEILMIVDRVFREFNFSNYTIRVNDRRLLRGIFEQELNIPDNLILPVYREIDKLDKIGLEGVEKELSKLLSKEKVEKIKEIISYQGKPEEVLEFIESKYGKNEEVKNALENMKAILDTLPLKVREKVALDLSLVRGLDYYTGMIYEAVVSEPRIGSLSGGGRYDNLIGLFANEPVPAVGGSIGVERLIDAGLELGIFKADKKTLTQVAVIYIGNTYKKALEIANALRERGINVYIDLMKRNFKKQMDYVIEKGIRYLVIVGERDLKEGKVTFQDRETKERRQIPVGKVVEEVSKILGA